MPHVVDNVRYADESGQSLTPEEKAVIDSIQKTYHDKRQIPCTSCKYCMPCPSGVDIPQSFGYYNVAHMTENVKKARFWYNRIGKASNCAECGQCEKHCPQNIPIINKLKEVADLLKLKMRFSSSVTGAWPWKSTEVDQNLKEYLPK